MRAGFFSLLMLLAACGQKDSVIESKDSNRPGMAQISGFESPEDGLVKPTVIPVDENKLKKIAAGQPKVTQAATIVFPAGLPRSVVAGNPRICIPGHDTFSLPKKIPARGLRTACGIPVCWKTRAIRTEQEYGLAPTEVVFAASTAATFPAFPKMRACQIILSGACWKITAVISGLERMVAA